MYVSQSSPWAPGRVLVAAVMFLAMLLLRPGSSAGADKAAIEAAIRKGSNWLAGQMSEVKEEGDRTLAALALLKSHHPENSPAIQTVVAEILARCANNQYNPGPHHIYEAGVEINLLVDLDPEKYSAQVKLLSEYLQSQQLPNGGWDYPSGREGIGDTSVVQYACLGLWAAERAGHPVPRKVWENAIRWHAATILSDGGFTYLSGTTTGAWNGLSSLNMTAAALGSLMICARNAYPGRADDLAQLLSLPKETEKPEGKPDADDSPVMKVDLSQAPEADAQPAGDAALDISVVRDTVRKAFGWMEPRYVPIRDAKFGDQNFAWRMYYLYTSERMASLINRERIGKYNWYDDASTAILQAQQNDGSWFVDTNYQAPWRDTAFALLFLSRSTGKILKRTTPEEKYGGGLLTGGKGEPVESVAAKKEPTPLDQLLQSLQNPGALNLEQAQSELIEQVQLGDRTELIGQKDMLVKLIQHPHGEVRRTAAWALGRTNDLRLARYLIDALEDKDVGVMMEAHAALCWLSRRFDGFGLPVNPLDEVGENASDAEKQTAIDGWRVRARRNWGNWYLRVRPYADRGDEFEARLRERLGEK